MNISGKAKRIAAVLLASVVASSALTIPAIGAPTDNIPGSSKQIDNVKKAEKTSPANFAVFGVSNFVEGVYLKKDENTKEKLKAVNNNYIDSSAAPDYCWSPCITNTLNGKSYNYIYLTIPSDIDYNKITVTIIDDKRNSKQVSIKQYSENIEDLYYLAYSSSMNVQSIKFKYSKDGEPDLTNELSSDDLINVFGNADVSGSHHISLNINNGATAGSTLDVNAETEKRYIDIGSKLQQGGNVFSFNKNNKQWNVDSCDLSLKASSDYEEFYTGDKISLSVDIPSILNLKSDDYSVKYYEAGDDGLDIFLANGEYTIPRGTDSLKFRAEITIGKDEDEIIIMPELDIDEIEDGYPVIESCKVVKDDINDLPNILSFGIFSKNSVEIMASYTDPGSPSFSKAQINGKDAALNNNNTFSLTVDPSYSWIGKADNFVKIILKDEADEEVLSENVSYNTLTTINEIGLDEDEEILVDINEPHFGSINGKTKWSKFSPKSNSGVDFSFEVNSENESAKNRSGLNSVSIKLYTQNAYKSNGEAIDNLEMKGQNSSVGKNGYIKLERVKEEETSELPLYSSSKVLKDNLKTSVNFSGNSNAELQDGKYVVEVTVVNNLGVSNNKSITFTKDTSGPDIRINHIGGEGVLYDNTSYYTSSNAQFVITVKDKNITNNTSISEKFSCMVKKDDGDPEEIDKNSITWTWNDSKKQYEGTVEFLDDGLYELSDFNCSDDLDNQSDNNTNYKFGIDSKSPEMNVDFTKTDDTSDPLVIDQTKSVFDKKVNVKVTVEDKTVYQEGLSCSLHKGSSKGEVCSSFVLTASEKKGDVISYEGTVDASEFDNYEGSYFLVIDELKDKLGNPSPKKSYPVYIDVNGPKVQISYSENVKNKLLNMITFGFYRSDEIKVAVKITDAVTGINKDSIKVEGMNDVPEFNDVNNNGKELTFEKILDKNFAYNIRVSAQDNLGHDSSSIYQPSKTGPYVDSETGETNEISEIAQISGDKSQICPSIAVSSDKGYKKDGVTWYGDNMPSTDSINSNLTINDIKDDLKVHPGLKSVNVYVYYKPFDKDDYYSEPVAKIIDKGSTNENELKSGAFTLKGIENSVGSLDFTKNKVTQKQYNLISNKSELQNGFYQVLVKAENNILDDTNNYLSKSTRYVFVYNNSVPQSNNFESVNKDSYTNENDFSKIGNIDFFTNQEYTLTLNGTELKANDIKTFNYSVMKYAGGKFKSASKDDYVFSGLNDTANGVTTSFTFEKDGVYKLSVEKILDGLGNEITCPESVIFGIDNTVPEVNDLVLTPAAGTVANALNDNGIYDRAVNVKFTVKDQNLTTELLKGENFTAVISGTGIKNEIELDLDWEKNNTEYTATAIINDNLVENGLLEGDYTVKITKCIDGLNKESDDLKLKSFTIDNTEPTIDISYEENITNKILEYLSFGFYRSEDINVTIKIEDNITNTAGYSVINTIDNSIICQKTLKNDGTFEFTNNNDVIVEDISDLNGIKKGEVIAFKLKKEKAYNISVSAYDMFARSQSQVVKPENDSQNNEVVEAKGNKITNAPSDIVNKGTVSSTNSENVPAINISDTEAKKYNSGDIAWHSETTKDNINVFDINVVSCNDTKNYIDTGLNNVVFNVYYSFDGNFEDNDSPIATFVDNRGKIENLKKNYKNAFSLEFSNNGTTDNIDYNENLVSSRSYKLTLDTSKLNRFNDNVTIDDIKGNSSKSDSGYYRIEVIARNNNIVDQDKESVKELASSAKSYSFGLDIDKPVVKTEYTDKRGKGQYLATYYNSRIAKITVYDRTLNPELLKDPSFFVYSITNSGGGEVRTIDNWESVDGMPEGTYTASYEFTDDPDLLKDGNFTFNVDSCKDSLDHLKVIGLTDEFQVDTTNPVITYNFNTEGKKSVVDGKTYYDSERTLTISIQEFNFNADDCNSKQFFKYELLNEFKTNLKLSDWSYDDETCTFKTVYTFTDSPSNENDGFFSVDLPEFYDKAGNAAYNEEGAVYSGHKESFIIDTTAPQIDISFVGGNRTTDKNGNVFYDSERKATVTVKEHNMTLKDLKDNSKYFTNLIKDEQNNDLYLKWEKGSEDNTFVGTYTFVDDPENNNDGKYTVSFNSFNDKAGNAAAKDGETFNSFKDTFIIDTTAPVIVYSYNDKDDTSRFYQNQRTLTVKVTEHNFYNADEMLEKFKLSIKDEHGSEVSRDWVKSGNTYTMTYTFIDDKNDPDDGRFDIVLPQFKDKANNQAVNGDKVIFSQYKRTFSIDETNPVINVSYSDTSTLECSHKGYDYYRAPSLTATITVIEHNFDYNNVNKNFAFKSYCDIRNNVTGTDKLELNSSDWNNRWKHNGNTHTIQIVLQGNTRYNSFTFTSTDLSGRQRNMPAKNKFVIDNTPPKQLTVTYSRNPVAKLIENITFGLYKSDVDITVSAVDSVAGIKRIDYAYAGVNNSRGGGNSIDYSNSSSSPSHDASTTFTVSPQFKGVIQFTVTDFTGNVSSYDTTNSGQGILVDDILPNIDTLAPVINIAPAQSPRNGIFNSDVRVNVNVIDPITGNVASGVDRITYMITDKVHEKSSQPKDISNSNKSSNTFNTSFIVDSKEFNSNDVEITVTAYDNATNSSKKSITVKIDTTVPTIQVAYTGGGAYNSVNGKNYYNADRTAVITVTERNFDAKDVVCKVNGSDTAVEWTTTASMEPDNTKHIGRVLFSKDNDYTFDFGFTDMAGNKAADVPQEKFTLDKTNPVTEIVFDNNDSKNINYYARERTATITIKEHNFDPSGFRLSPLSYGADNVTEVDPPKMSNWTNNGDIHYATIHYSKDGKHSFKVDYTDLAKNNAAAQNSGEFYIDTVQPEVRITNIQNNKAYDGNISFTVLFSDVNYGGEYNYTIEKTDIGSEKSDASSVFNVQESADKTQLDSLGLQTIKDNDGIYVLSATATDKAGNQRTSNVKFSVNRFGSTYELIDGTSEINGAYLNEEHDAVIREINVDPIEPKSVIVTRGTDETTLVKDKDFSCNVTGSDSTWYTAVYKIDKSVFEKEGVYAVKIASDDSKLNVTNTNLDEDKNNDNKQKLVVNFVIDKTGPLISLSGIDSNVLYEEDKKKLIINCEDSNFEADTLEVKIGDKIIPLSEDSIQKVDSGITITLDLSSSDYPDFTNIEVSVKDKAGNVSTEKIENFKLSASALERFLSNTTLVIISGIGILVLIAIVTIIIVFARKKKKAAQN